MMNYRLYKLSSDCLPVKGFSRSLIYDLTRKSYDFIPNSLFEIIKDGFIDLNACYDLIDESSRPIIDEYISFLLNNEYVFEISNLSEIDNYPDIDLKFDYPSEIANAVIDFNGDYDLLSKSIQQLDELNCNFLVLRILNKTSDVELKSILNLFNDSVIFSIEILASYSTELVEEKAKFLALDYPRLNRITLFNSPEEKHISSYLNNGMGHIVYTPKKYDKDKILKIRNENSFSINIKVVTESINYNPFFNKKVYISETGEVKNSPFSNTIFGSINLSNLSEIIYKPDFKDLWNAKKDNIDSCKDCEFRYMCIDNRTPIKKEESKWYFEDECAYNPYENEWISDAKKELVS